MALVVTGRLNKQIAADLSLSVATVKLNRGNVMRKMRAIGRAGMDGGSACPFASPEILAAYPKG
jgi:hypothetical protein